MSENYLTERDRLRCELESYLTECQNIVGSDGEKLVEFPENFNEIANSMNRKDLNVTEDRPWSKYLLEMGLLDSERRSGIESEPIEISSRSIRSAPGEKTGVRLIDEAKSKPPRPVTGKSIKNPETIGVSKEQSDLLKEIKGLAVIQMLDNKLEHLEEQARQVDWDYQLNHTYDELLFQFKPCTDGANLDNGREFEEQYDEDAAIDEQPGSPTTLAASSSSRPITPMTKQQNPLNSTFLTKLHEVNRLSRQGFIDKESVDDDVAAESYDMIDDNPEGFRGGVDEELGQSVDDTDEVAEQKTASESSTGKAVTPMKSPLKSGRTLTVSVESAQKPRTFLTVNSAHSRVSSTPFSQGMNLSWTEATPGSPFSMKDDGMPSPTAGSEHTGKSVKRNFIQENIDNIERYKSISAKDELRLKEVMKDLEADELSMSNNADPNSGARTNFYSGLSKEEIDDLSAIEKLLSERNTLYNSGSEYTTGGTNNETQSRSINDRLTRVNHQLLKLGEKSFSHGKHSLADSDLHALISDVTGVEGPITPHSARTKSAASQRSRTGAWMPITLEDVHEEIANILDQFSEKHENPDSPKRLEFCLANQDELQALYGNIHEDACRLYEIRRRSGLISADSRSSTRLAHLVTADMIQNNNESVNKLIDSSLNGEIKDYLRLLAEEGIEYEQLPDETSAQTSSPISHHPTSSHEFSAKKSSRKSRKKSSGGETMSFSGEEFLDAFESVIAPSDDVNQAKNATDFTNSNTANSRSSSGKMKSDRTNSELSTAEFLVERVERNLLSKARPPVGVSISSNPIVNIDSKSSWLPPIFQSAREGPDVLASQGIVKPSSSGNSKPVTPRLPLLSRESSKTRVVV